MAGKSQGIRAGRAYVEVYADNNALSRGLKAAEQKVQSFGKVISAIGAGLTGIGASIVSPFLKAAEMFSTAGSDLADASARTGASVETLSALGFAANQTGTDLATLESSFRQMQKALVKGSEENLQAEAAFQSLGLSVDRLMQMSPDEQFNAIARSIAAIPNPTAKAAMALQVFGKSGTQLIPLIDDMDALTSQARELGLVMSTEDAEAADALGDAMDTVKATLGRVVQVIGASLAPLLTDTAESISRTVASVVEWVDANRGLIVTAFRVGAAITAVGAAVTAAGVAIYGLGAVLGVAATAVGGVVAVLGAALSPIGLLTAGLAGLATWFVTSTEVGGQSLSWLGQRFGELYKSASDAFKGIGDALKAGDIALAGQVLWAGLKVEWLKGVGFLDSVWADWGTATIEVFRGISYQIAGLMLDAWAAIQKGFVNAIGVMQDVWTSFGGFFAKVWEQIKSLFTGSDITAEIERINKEVADTQARRAEGRQTQVAGIDANNAGAQQALKDQQQSEIDARRQAAQQGLAGNAAALKAAQDELASLMTQAGDKAASVGGMSSSKPGAGAPDFTPESLDQAVQQTKAKVDVSGSFSASALAGLGVGSSIADDQLKEQKKTNDRIEKLTNTVRTKQVAFT